VKQALLKFLRDSLPSKREKKGSHANKQKIRKTDVALTSHSLELGCQFCYSSAAVGDSQVGRQSLTDITVGTTVNQLTYLWKKSKYDLKM